MAVTLNDLMSLFNQLGREKFFGTIELKYEDGSVQYIRKSETIKSVGITKERDDAANNR